MLNVSNSTNRYSDKDLAEFKTHIEQKLEIDKKQLNSTLERIENISDSQGNDGDWMDDSSNNQDLEMLYGMVGRQRKHIRDLENALIRVHNKNYGICIATGNLIDKRRLMAVPTTTKSLEAKNALPEKAVREESETKRPAPTNTPTSFTRIIKRTSVTPTVKPKVEDDDYLDDEDDELDLDLDLDFEDSDDVDLEEIVDDTTDIDE